MKRLRLREGKEAAQGTQLIKMDVNQYLSNSTGDISPSPYTYATVSFNKASRWQKCHCCVYRCKMLFGRDLHHPTQSVVLRIPWEFTENADCRSSLRFADCLCHPQISVCALQYEQAATSHRSLLKLVKKKNYPLL